MFRKLLSNLPFNPSLIGQVSFYAKRMHGEERIRRMGMVLVIISMLVQMFAIISPPEPTLARSANDIIPGGFSKQSTAIEHCRKNAYDFKTILAHFNISCDSLAEASVKNIRSTDYDKKLLSLGRLPYGKTGERAITIKGKTYYQRYLWSWDSRSYSTYKSLVGKTVDGKPFMVLFSCGNPTVVETPPPAPAPKPKPTPEPTPTYTPGSAKCLGLSAAHLGPNRYKFTARTGGTDYVVKSYTFSFGDGNSKRLKTGAYRASVEHTYKKAGAYTARARIAINKQGTNGVVSDVLRCSTKLSFKSQPEPVTQPQPEPQPEPMPEPQTPPCEDAVDNNDVTACLILNKTASNKTQGIENANGTVAQASDVIDYTLTVTNTGNSTVKGFIIEENIGDILDYAKATDYHGGTVSDDFIVSWPAVDIGPGQKISKRLTVQIKDPIPSTPISSTNPGTYDLTMTNVYGDTVNIELPPSVTKTTEQVVQNLPNTGPGESMAGAVIITIFFGYFFARTKLYAKELDIVRTDYATSGGY